MASVVEALRRVKDDPAQVLRHEVIESACRRCGHAWRERALGPVATVHAMVLQALHGNAAIGEVVRLHHASFSGGAFCRARGRLPLEPTTSRFLKLATRLWLLPAIRRELTNQQEYH